MRIFNFFKKYVDDAQAEKITNKPSFLLKQRLVSLTGKKGGITILEAGASGGEDTLEWEKIPEVSIIYAFEPEPVSFKKLIRLTKSSSKIKCFELGLAKEKGTRTFYISKNISVPDSLGVSSSMRAPKEHLKFHPNVKFIKKSEISVVNLDEWTKHKGIRKIDIAWLDMQGSEFEVLSSSPNIMKTIDVIYTEVSLKLMYEESPLYPEYRNWLEQNGFEVYEEILPWEDMGNVIFRREKK